MSDDAPKSAYELAMERLRQKDKEASVEERPLTEKQKAAIAEARQFHQAKSAEREILHQAAMAAARTHEEVDKLNEELAGRGRVLVRPSGTEPVIRVLAEAETEQEAAELCASITALVARELG